MAARGAEAQSRQRRRVVILTAVHYARRYIVTVSLIDGGTVGFQKLNYNVDLASVKRRTSDVGRRSPPAHSSCTGRATIRCVHALLELAYRNCIALTLLLPCVARSRPRFWPQLRANLCWGADSRGHQGDGCRAAEH